MRARNKFNEMERKMDGRSLVTERYCKAHCWHELTEGIWLISYETTGCIAVLDGYHYCREQQHIGLFLCVRLVPFPPSILCIPYSHSRINMLLVKLLLSSRPVVR